MTFAVNLATVGSNATATGTLLQSGTAVASTSGTSINFTSIPAWVKRVTVMFNQISTTGGTANYLVQLGDAGGIEASGYSGRVCDITSGTIAFSTGFALTSDNSAALINSGAITMSLLGSNIWTEVGILSRTDGGNNQYRSAGVKQLSDTLTQVRVTTTNGTDTFDAGSINILYE
jgi:hypothetical protein